MKNLFYIFLFLFFTEAFSQDFSAVDKKVLNYPEYYDMYELTNRISKDFDTDMERVRAIYTWIVDNISYSYRAADPIISYSYRTQEELERKKRLQRIRTAKNTVIKKAAVCHGYSTLFGEMCKLLKIESKYVSGMAKNKPNDIGKKFDSNHAWNIVKINKKEYLVDATWGAGAYDSRDGFKKNNTYFYFFTDPNIFIKNHYPDDFRDSLLDHRISKLAFQSTPVYYIKNDKGLKLITPKLGKINKHHREKIKFSYKVENKINSVSYLLGNEFFDIYDYTITGKILSFNISVFNVDGNDVLIYINGKAINAFKLR